MPSSRVLRTAAAGLSAASLLVPVAMLAQLVVSLGTDRSTRWWGLLSVRLENSPASTSVQLGVDGVATVVLWLALTALFTVVCTAVPSLLRRPASRP